MDELLNIALLVKLCDKVRGRKKLQKMVHILQEAGYPFREPFSYLHHGPYSSVLKAELDELTSDNFKLLKEDGQQLSDYIEYVYTPEEKLDKILDSMGVNNKPEWKELAEDLNNKPASYLEAVSTILYLRRLSFDSERLKSKFKELKPKLASSFDSALNTVSEIETIRSKMTSS